MTELRVEYGYRKTLNEGDLPATLASTQTGSRWPRAAQTERFTRKTRRTGVWRGRIHVIRLLFTVGARSFTGIPERTPSRLPPSTSRSPINYLPRSLTKLNLNRRFNQPLSVGDLPATLTDLDLGAFNHPLLPHVLPSSLKKLIYSTVLTGRCN